MPIKIKKTVELDNYCIELTDSGLGISDIEGECLWLGRKDAEELVDWLAREMRVTELREAGPTETGRINSKSINKSNIPQRVEKPIPTAEELGSRKAVLTSPIPVTDPNLAGPITSEEQVVDLSALGRGGAQMY